MQLHGPDRLHPDRRDAAGGLPIGGRFGTRAATGLSRIGGTPIGEVAVLWSTERGAPLVIRVLLPGEPAPGGIPEAVGPGIDAVCTAVRRMASGEPATIPLAALDLSGCTPFQGRVLRALHAIPRGAVTTYALLAARVGRPGAARAVGQVMATNPFPLIVPCHRVIRSDGTLGGFGGGPAMKRTLLTLEGIAIDAAGRIPVSRFHCDQVK